MPIIIDWGYGSGGSGSGSPLATPSLAVVDNANGTGTATVSSSDAAATNTIYTTPADGNLSSAVWTSRGSRTGDGAVTLTLANGIYWVRCRSETATQSAEAEPRLLAVTDGLADVHERIVLAVVSRLQSLTLAGTADSTPDIPGSRIYDQMLPAEDLVQFPCVLATIEGEKEQLRLVVMGRDDYGYPVRVQICDRADQNASLARGKYLNWRHQCMEALISQRLPGVSEVQDCVIEPATIIDPRLPSYKYMVSGFVARFFARRPRGLR